MVPGAHRKEEVKIFPKCREDPLSLFHKQELEAGSDQLLVATLLASLFLFLGKAVSVVCPLLPFRSEKDALQPAKEALNSTERARRVPVSS